MRVPCSRVAHLFRQKGWKQIDKSFDGDSDIRQRATLHNNKRIAETWLSPEYLNVFLKENQIFLISEINTGDKDSF